MSALERLLGELAREIAKAVVAELRAGDAPGMLDQSASPLGRRRHIALARELIAANSSEAARIGRRYLVTRTAVEARAAELSKRETCKPTPDDLAPLRAKFGLKRAS